MTNAKISIEDIVGYIEFNKEAKQLFEIDTLVSPEKKCFTVILKNGNVYLTPTKLTNQITVGVTGKTRNPEIVRFLCKVLKINGINSLYIGNPYFDSKLSRTIYPVLKVEQEKQKVPNKKISRLESFLKDADIRLEVIRDFEIK